MKDRRRAAGAARGPRRDGLRLPRHGGVVAPALFNNHNHDE